MEAARLAEAQARRRQRLLASLALVAVVAVVAGALYVLLGDDDSDETAEAGASTLPLEEDPSASDPVVSDPPTGPTVPLPPPPTGRAIEGETPCPATDGSEERVASFTQAPPMCLTDGEALEAVVETTAGSFTIALDSAASPATVNNWVVLARYKFFDGLPFHRLLPDQYAQTGSGGEPTWGAGGPGYDLGEGELPAEPAPYAAGDVAMAKGESVSGSQWFVVVTDAAAANLDLQPVYPRFGRVTEGLDVVAAMSAKGDPNPGPDGSDGNPTELIVVTSVTIRPAG